MYSHCHQYCVKLTTFGKHLDRPRTRQGLGGKDCSTCKQAKDGTFTSKQTKNAHSQANKQASPLSHTCAPGDMCIIVELRIISSSLRLSKAQGQPNRIHLIYEWRRI